MFWRGLSPSYQLIGFADCAYSVLVVFFEELSLKKGLIVILKAAMGTTVLQT